MNRRDFIALASAAVWPIATHAQLATKVYRLGLLGGSPRGTASGRLWEDFFQGLRDLG
jgi:hypothetical protein